MSGACTSSHLDSAAGSSAEVLLSSVLSMEQHLFNCFAEKERIEESFRQTLLQVEMELSTTRTDLTVESHRPVSVHIAQPNLPILPLPSQMEMDHATGIDSNGKLPRLTWREEGQLNGSSTGLSSLPLGAESRPTAPRIKLEPYPELGSNPKVSFRHPVMQIKQEPADITPETNLRIELPSGSVETCSNLDKQDMSHKMEEVYGSKFLLLSPERIVFNPMELPKLEERDPLHQQGNLKNYSPDQMMVEVADRNLFHARESARYNIQEEQLQDVHERHLLNEQEGAAQDSQEETNFEVLPERLEEANFEYLEMTQDTMESFKELARLVVESTKRSFKSGNLCDSIGYSPASASNLTRWDANTAGMMDSRAANSYQKMVVYEGKAEPWEESDQKTAVMGDSSKNLVNWDDVEMDRPGELVDSRQNVMKAMTTFETLRKRCLESSQTLVPDPTKRKYCRPDLSAGSLMRAHGSWVNERDRVIGDVPGVKVGDCFRYRIEMCMVGLHKMTQAGIAIVPSEHSPWRETVAASVVLVSSGGRYGDDCDNGETVTYSGQGGLCKSSKQNSEYQDQELKRGNLALANSYKHRSPIRLIRGHKNITSPSGIIYSYDGLYEAKAMRYEVGVQGKFVYKFNLHRLPGQPPLTPVPENLPPPLLVHQPLPVLGEDTRLEPDPSGSQQVSFSRLSAITEPPPKSLCWTPQVPKPELIYYRREI